MVDALDLTISEPLIDTHCHIHFPDYPLDADEARQTAVEHGVTKLICVGCTLEDSRLGVEYVATRNNTWASIGLHPHEAKQYVGNEAALDEFRKLASRPKVVAIGECGLDYYYNHSLKTDQESLLRFQIDVALEHNLPLIFHVRDAFDDFLPILGDYPKLRGVVHSFSATDVELKKILEQTDLYIGFNGIMTFTKDQRQLEAVKITPIERIVVETDAPYLTPAPFRGKVCEPKHVRTVAAFIADLRGENSDEFARITTQNAQSLFHLN